MSGALDYSIARPGGRTIRAAGFSDVLRYTGAWRYDGAIITKAEYEDLVANGIRVGLVMEYSASWLSQGYAYGHAAALAARDLEHQMGIPDGLTYAAADWDITLGGPPQSPAALDNCKRALDTMHGMADAYGGWGFVAPYGSKYFVEWCAQNSPMHIAWSTQAWSNYIPANDAVLYQYAGWPDGVPYVAGCDYNEIRGNYQPRGGAAPTPTPSPTPTPGDIVSQLHVVDLNREWDFRAPVLRTIRGLLCAWGVKVGGVLITPDDTNSARMRQAVHDFQVNMRLPADKVVGPKTWAALLLAAEV